MKTIILLLTTLIFSLTMFASTSFAEWTKVTKNSGGTFYIDFDKIKKDGGYVYFWELSDLIKPNKDGKLSAKIYNRMTVKYFGTSG
jgi:hypothetical protein